MDTEPEGRLMTREEAEGGNWRLEPIFDAYEALKDYEFKEVKEILEYLLWTVDFDEDDEDCHCQDCEDDDMSAFICVDCGVNTAEINEYYMVNDVIWLRATGALNMRDEDAEGMFCIGCLEARLGRKLNAGDFTDCPLNVEAERFVKSPRLLDRMGL